MLDEPDSSRANRQRLGDVTSLRVGQGFDVHAFAPGRPLILGGVRIAHDAGLAGHSDGDALLHALADAVLGASGLGDIGQRFPSDDPRYAGVASEEIIRTVVAEVCSAGWMPVNVDTTVIAQAPRLVAYVPAMRTKIAELLGLDVAAVGVKAKTADHLGALGRHEGLAALAVVLLERREGALLSSRAP